MVVRIGSGTSPTGQHSRELAGSIPHRAALASEQLAIRIGGQGTVDLAERTRLLREAQHRIADLAIEIPLYNVTKLDAVPATLQGFKGNPTNAGAFWNVHEWEVK